MNNLVKGLQCFVITLLCLLNSACRDLVNIRFDDYRKEPVMNAIIAAGEPLSVSLSYVAPVNTVGVENIDNAQVNLMVDGTPAGQLLYDADGIYISTVTAQDGKTYRFEVAIPGNEAVTAQSGVPQAGRILDVESTKKAGIDSEGIAYPALKITFSNDHTERKYYEVLIKLMAYGEERYAELEKIIDPVILNEGVPIALFSNELITNTTYQLKLNYTTGSVFFTGNSAPEYELFPLVVELRTVSEEYYRYARQLYLYNQSRYPTDIGSTGTASQLYSNVDNGYGIVAAYTSSVTETIQP